VLMGANAYGSEWPAIERRLNALEGVTHAQVFTDQRIYYDDRLLYRIPPSADVPATELINGAHQGFLQDVIHVYTLE